MKHLTSEYVDPTSFPTNLKHGFHIGSDTEDNEYEYEYEEEEEHEGDDENDDEPASVRSRSASDSATFDGSLSQDDSDEDLLAFIEDEVRQKLAEENAESSDDEGMPAKDSDGKPFDKISKRLWKIKNKIRKTHLAIQAHAQEIEQYNKKINALSLEIGKVQKEGYQRKRIFQAKMLVNDYMENLPNELEAVKNIALLATGAKTIIDASSYRNDILSQAEQFERKLKKAQEEHKAASEALQSAKRQSMGVNIPASNRNDNIVVPQQKEKSKFGGFFSGSAKKVKNLLKTNKKSKKNSSVIATTDAGITTAQVPDATIHELTDIEQHLKTPSFSRAIPTSTPNALEEDNFDYLASSHRTASLSADTDIPPPVPAREVVFDDDNDDLPIPSEPPPPLPVDYSGILAKSDAILNDLKLLNETIENLKNEIDHTNIHVNGLLNYAKLKLEDKQVFSQADHEATEDITLKMANIIEQVNKAMQKSASSADHIKYIENNLDKIPETDELRQKLVDEKDKLIAIKESLHLLHQKLESANHNLEKLQKLEAQPVDMTFNPDLNVIISPLPKVSQAKQNKTSSTNLTYEQSATQTKYESQDNEKEIVKGMLTRYHITAFEAMTSEFYRRGKKKNINITVNTNDDLYILIASAKVWNIPAEKIIAKRKKINFEHEKISEAEIQDIYKRMSTHGTSGDDLTKHLQKLYLELKAHALSYKGICHLRNLQAGFKSSRKYQTTALGTLSNLLGEISEDRITFDRVNEQGAVLSQDLTGLHF